MWKVRLGILFQFTWKIKHTSHDSKITFTTYASNLKAFIVPVLKYLCIHIKFNNIWKILYTRVQFLRLADTMGARITLVLFSSIWHAQSYHTAPIIKYFINIQLCTFFIKYFLNVWYHDKLYAITFLTWPPLISYACMAYRMRLVHIPLRLALIFITKKQYNSQS